MWNQKIFHILIQDLLYDHTEVDMQIIMYLFSGTWFAFGLTIKLKEKKNPKKQGYVYTLSRSLYWTNIYIQSSRFDV